MTSFHYDRWIISATLILIGFGLLMVASASMVVADKQHGYSLFYFLRQAIFAGMGLAAIWFTTRIPLKFWQQSSGILMLIGIGLLVVVLIPGIGKVVNGSRRWLNFGFVALQVSEAVKLFAIIYLASYLQRFQNQVQYEFKGFIKPILLLGFMAGLLLLEPDFGASVVIAATFMALLFLAGARLWPFTLLLILMAAAAAALAITSPYRLQRLTTFLNPWGHAFGSGYQLTQSLIAFGRGGLFGVGLGNSVQKLFYLPEAHTDFIFAVIAEELGLVGEILLIAVYVVLIARMYGLGRYAQRHQHLFAAYIAYGVAVWFGLQAMINMGVNAGVLPTKGLTLPFISYGGSSMLVNSVVIGLILRIAFELKFIQPERRSYTSMPRARET